MLPPRNGMGVKPQGHRQSHDFGRQRRNLMTDTSSSMNSRVHEYLSKQGMGPPSAKTDYMNRQSKETLR
jgi:hypothetical protein